MAGMATLIPDPVSTYSLGRHSLAPVYIKHISSPIDRSQNALQTPKMTFHPQFPISAHPRHELVSPACEQPVFFIPKLHTDLVTAQHALHEGHTQVILNALVILP